MPRAHQVPTLAPDAVISPRDRVLNNPAAKARLMGLLSALKGRAGERYERVGMALAAGHSWETAANLAGIGITAVGAYRRKYPDVSDLLAECESVGFSIYESELQARALAGSDDRNSARLLEIVLKARRAEYRDRQQVSIDVMHRAERALTDVIGGWDVEPAADSK